MQSVTGLARDGDQLVVTLSDSGPVRCTAVILAMGARYRRLDVPSLEALIGAGVFYGGPTSEASALTGRDVFIVGGANSAGQAALHLARYARTVTLVVRADSLRAGMSEYLVRQIEATDNIEARLGCQVVGGGGDGRLEHLVLRDIGSRDRSRGRGERALPPDRSPAEHRLASAGRRTGRAGIRSHRSRCLAASRIASRSQSVSPRDEHARRVRRRRRPPRCGEACRLGGRRRLHRHSVPASALRRRATPAARPIRGTPQPSREWAVAPA